ncbi:hypothetical protein IHC92_11900 [Photobacterium damselae subsp. damselae]|uniref:nuclease domain-containing protein n=1 Tax=Photobacterium damselae TaxID=38293 RepID=UPI001F30ECCB|nr:nuclease domain-containing protein [Photobacterium damselae]UKA05821.1 hypothetical protein IHC90_11895 [Photobacterium damselae subsp. damselae]UKA20927.1 hypothetical protein IHC92_11900 [Photobacterium damselae subsp. damselae]
MSINIRHIKDDYAIEAVDGVFEVKETQEYLVTSDSEVLEISAFGSVMTKLNDKQALLKAVNKISALRFNGVTVRIISKLGDEFYQGVKKAISAYEDKLLISSNGLQDTFALTHRGFVEEVALAVLLESWRDGRLKREIDAVVAKNLFGLTSQRTTKNLSRGVRSTATDFQHMCATARTFALHQERKIPIEFNSYQTTRTNNVIQLRFLKFFLCFALNLVRRVQGQINNAKALKSKDINKSRSEQLNKKLAERDELNEKLAELDKLRVWLNAVMKHEKFNGVSQSMNLDFTSLKIHNDFHLKYLLGLYLKMRSEFKAIDNENTVFLDVNSLENLYEYYCFLRLLDEFEVEPQVIKGLIKKDLAGWIIDKSLFISIGDLNGFACTLTFQKSFSLKKGSYSQTYEPDYTLTMKSEDRTYYLHFDAKYKTNEGRVKKEDIDKMHTYTHAIKNTIGSVVLFPGNQDCIYKCSSSNVGALFFTPCENRIDFKHKLLDQYLKIF